MVRLVIAIVCSLGVSSLSYAKDCRGLSPGEFVSAYSDFMANLEQMTNLGQVMLAKDEDLYEDFFVLRSRMFGELYSMLDRIEITDEEAAHINIGKLLAQDRWDSTIHKYRSKLEIPNALLLIDAEHLGLLIRTVCPSGL